MGKGKINLLLVFFSGIGALVGFAIGELLLYKLGGSIPAPILMGLYFGQLAFFVGIMCLLAEMVSPKLNGLNWKRQYLKSSWLYLIPSTLVMLFVAGALFQFIYQSDGQGRKSPNDMMLVMDISGSMASTDPNKDALHAINEFIDNMTNKQRLGVITFDHESHIVQPMISVDNTNIREEIKNNITSLYQPGGGTEIEHALNQAMEHIQETKEKGRRAMVILLSDGYSNVDLDQTLSPYLDEGIVINTIGLMDPQDPSREGIELLQQIADATGGQFYNVEDTIDVTQVMHDIYKKDQTRWLVSERGGIAQDSLVYATLRIVFLGVIGLLIGLSVGIIFDNRYLAKAYIIGGIVSGILSGVILELFINRLLVTLCLGVVFTLFSIFADMKNKAHSFSNRSITGPKSFRKE